MLRALFNHPEICPFLSEPLVHSPGLVLLSGLTLPKEEAAAHGNLALLARR